MHALLLPVVITAAAALSVPRASAAVVDVGPAGFTVTETAVVAAPPQRVYEALIEPSHWWSPEHTYSHNAANLSLDARAGGCWCETLPGCGSVQHLVVVAAIPGNILRLRGALGPLQAMAVDGSMTVALMPSANTTHLAMTYAVGGYSQRGFAELSRAVDGVLNEQVARLKRLVETGTPDLPAVNETNKGVTR